MNLLIKKIIPEARINTPAYFGDAGYDVFATQTITLKPLERFNMPLGIAISFPSDCVCLVQQKSGNSVKKGFDTIGNVIDSSYRGEIHAVIVNTSNESITINKDDKVAQLLFLDVNTPRIEFVNELSTTERGEKGFGSSDKK